MDLFSDSGSNQTVAGLKFFILQQEMNQAMSSNQTVAGLELWDVFSQ